MGFGTWEGPITGEEDEEGKASVLKKDGMG